MPHALANSSQQRLLRFTLAICTFLHVKNAGLGRPPGDPLCRPNNHHSLLQDLQIVLNTLPTQDGDGPGMAGKRYCPPLQPHRTQDHFDESTVIKLLDRWDLQPAFRITAASL